MVLAQSINIFLKTDCFVAVLSSHASKLLKALMAVYLHFRRAVFDQSHLLMMIRRFSNVIFASSLLFLLGHVLCFPQRCIKAMLCLALIKMMQYGINDLSSYWLAYRALSCDTLCEPCPRANTKGVSFACLSLFPLVFESPEIF